MELSLLRATLTLFISYKCQVLLSILTQKLWILAHFPLACTTPDLTVVSLDQTEPPKSCSATLSFIFSQSL